MRAEIKHSTERTAVCNGIEIVYDTFGQENLPSMVLIMGLGSQMILWEDEFCVLLASRGFRVVRFDNRDVGRSAKLSHMGLPDFSALLSGKAVEVPYTLHDMAKDTVGLLDALHIEAAHIIGASMGGMIAQLMAVHYPARVRSLTSIMSTTGDPGLPGPVPEAMQVLFRPYPRDRERFIDAFIDTWRVLSGDQIPMDQGSIKDLAEKYLQRGVYPEGNARQLAAIIASGSRRHDLGSVKVPTLVIHGDADPLIPVECGLDTAQSIPGADLKIIPGMGHAFPDIVWQDIVDSIAGHALGC
ncbi:MAG TPA: alpha/beta hydrolase [Deltaproteobacteria bacterium]|nr:alpha/beta hydrolase [Deltaproteobacteria bacterium]